MGFKNHLRPVDELERVICSAIWIKTDKHEEDIHNYITPGSKGFRDNIGIVVAGLCHADCIWLIAATLPEHIPLRDNNSVQGFITSNRRFVDRCEGWKIARSAGQLKCEYQPEEGYLYSEHLY